MPRVPARTYIVAFVITAAIFGTAFYVSDYFNRKRIEQIQNIESRLSIDILSLETQFDLLEELSCTDIRKNPVLGGEINSLAQRLSYTESQLGVENEEVVRLKQQYTLLLIKDLLLTKRVSEKCGISQFSIIYFYSNEGDCPDCERQGYALSGLTEDYPDLRVYAFDYNLDLPALRTLLSIQKIQSEFPALIVGTSTLYGYQDYESLEARLPADVRTSATTTDNQ